MKIKRGSTSVRRLIFIADSSSATGAGLANLVYNSSGLVAYYFAGDLNNEVQITLASATLGSYTSGGFVAVDNTNMPGWYEIGIPDAALDGGNEVAIQLRGATNMVPVNVYIELDAVDYQSATNFGLSKFADIETDTQDIQSKLAGIMNTAQTQILYRSPDDIQPINIVWPVNGATITATVSINNGSFVSTTGTVTFLRTESTGKHIYVLSYNSADRPTSSGQARYILTDGTYTRSFSLTLANVDNDSIADSILVRDVVNVEASAPEHSLATIILGMLEFSISGNILTIKRTDGTTVHYTKTLTTNPNAKKITGID